MAEPTATPGDCTCEEDEFANNHWHHFPGCPRATPDADVRDGYAAVLHASEWCQCHVPVEKCDTCQGFAAALVASPHHHGVLAAERQAAVAPFLALADEWDEKLRREHGLPDDPTWTDWHSRDLRAAAQETTP